MSEIHTFGYWLKRRRRALDLTQAELANRVGCTAATIRKIEAEERRPSKQIAERLAVIFDIPQDEQADFLQFARGGWRAAPILNKRDMLWQVSTRVPRSSLPAPITSLVGREQEIAEIQAYLLRGDVRLVTLMGPPGVGKTRLSIEAARAMLPDFPDGVFFVALAPLEDPSLLARTIAQTLEFVERKGQSAVEQLIDSFTDKKMLIVLDNCEHLVEYVAMLAARLLSSCPRLKILATSRESLRISGEWMFPVPPLNVPREGSLLNLKTASEFPALILFAERARAAYSNFVLHDGNIQAAASLCSQLDGLPLAIELIAARMRFMTLKAVLEQLNDQFVLSADGMRSLSTRQNTLNDAIAWSYNLLSRDEQRFFACVSVFSGGFTLEAVEKAFSATFAGKPLSSLLTSLLDKSLLQRTSDIHDEFRFNMLVTIRHFALSCLQSMRKESEAHNAHLFYFLDVAEQADKEIRGPNQVEWLSRLSIERDNLRSALEWAIDWRLTEIALQIANHLSLFWFRRSDLSEGRQWLGRTVALSEAPQYPRLYSYALAQLAFHTWLQIGPEEARPFGEQALSVARAYEDKWNTAWALTVYGLILISESNFTVAQSMLEDSKVLFQELHDEWGYANAVISLGNGAYNQDDPETALALHEESLLVFRKLGDRYFESVALRFIGMLQVKQGDLTHGVGSLREALILAQQLDSRYEIAAGLECISNAENAEGNPARAVRLYWGSRNIFDSIGAWQEESDTEFEANLTTCRTALGDSEFAAAVEEGRAMTMEQAIAYALQDQN